MVLGGAGAPIATAVPVIMNAKKVAAPAAKRSAKRPAGTSAGKGSKVTGRSRLEFIGMALALHVLFGRKVRDIILMTRQYAVQAFSFGLQYLQRPWLLLSVLITMLFALITTTAALPYFESAADQERQRLRRKMDEATTYDQWRAHAMQCERIETSLKDNHRRPEEEDMGYDVELIESKVRQLRGIREHGSVREMMFHIRTDLLRDLGNMTSLRLNSITSVELPEPIEAYLEEVTKHLEIITRNDVPNFSNEDKLSFLQETRHAFGRTALVLSGGGSFGTFHLGLIKTLIEHNLVPRVLAGSSVGAIACAFLATRPEDQAMEVMRDLDDKPERMGFYSGTSMRQLFGHYVANGSLHSSDILQRRLRTQLGDLTFQEAYDLSGKILCITVSPTRKNESPRLLSYLTSPHVLVWSAVAASCAFPGLFAPQKLYAKDLSGNVVVYHGASNGADQASSAGGDGGRAEAEGNTARPSTGTPSSVTSGCGGDADEDSHPGLSYRCWRDGSLEDDLPLKRLSELFNANYFIVSQINPHIIPLLQAKQRLRNCGWIMGGIASLIESEVKHRIGQLREILGERGRSLTLLTQPWEGDVTIVMPATMKQYRGLIFNPTKSEYEFAFRQGQQNTWPKLHVIDANMRIEQCLDGCVAALRGSIGSRQSCLLQSGIRVPSWNTLACTDGKPAMGAHHPSKIVEGNESLSSSSSEEDSTAAKGSSDEDKALSKAAEELVLSLCNSPAPHLPEAS